MSKSEYSNFLTATLPHDLLFEWKISWGKIIVINLLNSDDVNQKFEFFKITICPKNRLILGMLRSRITNWDSFDDKWFGNEAKLSKANEVIYKDFAKVYVYEDLDTNYELFSLSWYNEFKNIQSGNLPSGLSKDKLSKILNGKLFSNLYSYIKLL